MKDMGNRHTSESTMKDKKGMKKGWAFMLVPEGVVGVPSTASCSS